jgi:hypothetical protein
MPLAQSQQMTFTMQSLVSGRPPLVSKRHFDVKLPLETPDAAEPDPNFSRGKYHFSEACLWDLLDISLSPTSKSTYTSVLKMDSRIRKWALPQNLRAPKYEPPREQQALRLMREATGILFREIVLMCLHRFVRLILCP